MLDLIKKEDVDKLVKPVPAFLKVAQEILIKNPDDCDRASGGLIKITAEQKKIKAVLDSAIGPIEDGIKQVKSWFKPSLDTLKEASELLRDKIGVYGTEMQRKIAEKQAEVAAKVEAGKISMEKAGQKIADLEVKADNKMFNSQGAMSFTTHKYVEVFDLKKVPLEYLMPNMVKINDTMLRDGIELPGCKIVVEQRPNIRTK